MDASNNALNGLPNLRMLLAMVADGRIPVNQLLTLDQMVSLYDLLWVEIYEDQQKKENGTDELLARKETKERKGQN